MASGHSHFVVGHYRLRDACGTWVSSTRSAHYSQAAAVSAMRRIARDGRGFSSFEVYDTDGATGHCVEAAVAAWNRATDD